MSIICSTIKKIKPPDYLVERDRYAKVILLPGSLNANSGYAYSALAGGGATRFQITNSADIACACKLLMSQDGSDRAQFCRNPVPTLDNAAAFLKCTRQRR